MIDDAKFGHALNQIENFGALRLKKVFDIFGSFKNCWEADPSQLKNKINDGFLVQFILENRNKINPEKEWREILEKGVKVITMNDSIYPPLLKEIAMPPSLLYFQGDILALSSNYSVAVVGTRRATYYGLETAFRLSRELALKGINIVSGLAMGVDTQAHRGCLEVGGLPADLSARRAQTEDSAKTGKTFAVLGSGLLKIHPRINFGLSQRIIEQGGAVISEYPPSLTADKWTFPQRNRIIAGLASLTLVAEAPEKSGALITARFALDSNRDVGIVPGEIHSIASKGSNKFLKHGAYPICEASDVLEILGIEEKPLSLFENEFFDKNELLILDGIKTAPFLEQLPESTGLDIKILNQKLSLLELKGAIRNINGRFERIK